MSSWVLKSFSKRVDYNIDILEYSNVLYNLLVSITLESSLSSYIQDVLDLCFVVDGEPVEFYDINISNLEFLVKIPSLNPDKALVVSVYYDRLNFDFLLPATKSDLKFYIYPRIYHNYYWHPQNHEEFITITYDCNNSLKGDFTSTSITTTANYGDWFCYYISINFYVSNNVREVASNIFIFNFINSIVVCI